MVKNMHARKSIPLESAFIRRSTLLSVMAALMLSVSHAHAAGPYDWSGFYVGVMGTASIGNNDVSVNYDIFGDEFDGDDFGYWGLTEDGEVAFLGGMHAFVRDIRLDGQYGYATGLLDGDLVEPWLTSLLSNPLGLGLGGYAGWTWQKENFVGGLELQASLVRSTDSYSNNWLEVSSNSDERTDIDSYTNNLFENAEGVFWGWTNNDDPDGGEDVTYLANVDQRNRLNYDFSTEWVVAPTVRAGVAHDRLQLFGFVGPTISSVSATTSARVTERANGTADSVIWRSDECCGDDDDYENKESAVLRDVGGYQADWSGENRQILYGYKVGAGVEYAVTDNLIARLVGEFSSLGTASVTGVSNETNATYTVHNSLSSFALTSGLSLKFN